MTLTPTAKAAVAEGEPISALRTDIKPPPAPSTVMQNANPCKSNKRHLSRCEFSSTGCGIGKVADNRGTQLYV